MNKKLAQWIRDFDLPHDIIPKNSYHVIQEVRDNETGELLCSRKSDQYDGRWIIHEGGTKRMKCPFPPEPRDS